MNYYEFIKIMKHLKDEDKFKYLYDYFYKNVSYNYVEWLYGYLFYGVNNFKKNYVEYNGELNKKNEKMLLCYLSNLQLYDHDSVYKPTDDDIIILDSIIKIRDYVGLDTISDIKRYKYGVQTLLNATFFSDLENDNVKKQLLRIFNKEIINKSFVPVKYGDYKVLFDITWMIYKSFSDNMYGKASYKNDLIRSGVCRHYSNFIKKVLDDLGIYTVNVIGQSGLFHEWNMVLINNEIRFIDITREIHLRNNAKDYEFKKGDWYLISIDDMFKLEEDRDIRELNGIKLDTFITKDNYKDNIDVLYNAFNHKVKVKKRDLFE